MPPLVPLHKEQLQRSWRQSLHTPEQSQFESYDSSFTSFHLGSQAQESSLCHSENPQQGADKVEKTLYQPSWPKSEIQFSTIAEALLLSYGTHRKNSCSQHPSSGVSHAREVRKQLPPVPFPTSKASLGTDVIFPIKGPCTCRVQAEEFRIPGPAEFVGDGTGRTCCEPPRTGHRRAAGAGNESPPQPNTPKLLPACS